jgi:hypothetical protein
VVRDSIHKIWLIRAIVCILTAAFGMQWVLMHVVVFGVSALSQDAETLFLKPSSVLIGNHQNCQVCDALSEQQEKSGDSQSGVTPEILEIEGLEFHRALMLGADDFLITEILMLYDPNWCANPFQLLKPPKAAA